MKCPKCGYENPRGARYCGYCQHKLKTENESVSVGKKIYLLVGAVLMGLLVILVILLRPCSHEWLDATCTEAKVCIKCEKTEGEAVGHEWKKATCTEPSACTRCGETKGTALGHKWKQVIEIDYVETKVITYSQCTICKEEKDQKTDDLMTLLSDNGKTFLIPPVEYSKRLEEIIATMDFDVEYSFVAQADDVCIEIRENGILSAMVFFYKDRKTPDPVRIQGEEKDKEAAFGSIQMVISRGSSEMDGLLTAFVAACEPVCATDPDLAYEIVVSALAYSGEEVVYPHGSLVYLMNISDDFVVLNAAAPEI